ncbi:MAG TPA: glycine cleavage system protein GcvH [Spirochaetota bacterium]|nr:glycine cleavage system protein GcvH [Spirochaetota bacterium]HPS85387.1 glycine cleavage system protein GcvH [Spirochaetota bacterium]
MKNPEKGMNVPDDLKYKDNHQWVKMTDDITGVCGITDFAQNNLGEITFVEFINNILNSEIEEGEKIAIIESPKDSLDVNSIVTGKIIEINRALEDSPELLNSDPYGDGWIFKIEVEDVTMLDDLLDPDEYLETILPDDFL